MPSKTRLNDLQLVLLSHAAKNEPGSVLPLPDAAAQDQERAAKELKSAAPQADRGSRDLGSSPKLA